MGATGFTGRALCRHLSENSARTVQVVKASISARGDPEVTECDCSKGDDVNHLLVTVKPHEVYHLVGSFSKEYETDYISNVLCAKNIFDAVLRQRGSRARVLVVGSAAAVGLVKRADLPVKETITLSPVTMYGLTKATQALLAASYARMYHLDVVVARAFNIVGYGISQQLFVGRLVAQIAAYLRGDIRRIVVGNLLNKRDYLDIRDVVAAYCCIMTRGKQGELYNVGSGTSIRIRRLLDLFLKAFDIPEKAIKCEAVATGRQDLRDIRCSNAKLRALGWRPTVTIQESINDIRRQILLDENPVASRRER